jgi:hypothetical protein
VSEDDVIEQEPRPESVRAVRLGHGANCSSIGSVVDTLFASAVIGSAILATVLAAMKKERVAVVRAPESKQPDSIDRGA